MSLPTTLLRKSVGTVLRHFGYELRPARNAELLPQVPFDPENPGAILYGAQIKPVLTELPIERGRSTAYPVIRHPFFLAARHGASARSDAVTAIAQVLETYRELADYRDALDRVDVSAPEAPLLAALPPWFRIDPWSNATLEERSRTLQRASVQEGRRDGYTFDPPAQGFLTTGNDAALEMHARRLGTVLASIRSRGFLRSSGPDGDITGELLIDGRGAWCWQISSGAHRACVAAALGYTTLPVRIVRIIYRADAAAWPQVARGVFSRQTATRLFDQLVAGQAPARIQRWIAYAESLEQAQPATLPRQTLAYRWPQPGGALT